MSDRDWLEEMQRRALTRRAFVKGGLAGAGALSLGGLLAACGGDDDDEAAAPAGTGEAEPFTGTLEVTGLGVDLIDPIKEAAEKALGFTLAYDVTDTVTARNKVVTQPEALDIFSGYFNDIDQVWPSGNMAPIPIDQIERWDQLTGLYKTGKIEENEANSGVPAGRRRRSLPEALHHRGRRADLVGRSRHGRGLRRRARLRHAGRRQLQHGLDGLQRRGHQAGAQRGQLGRAPQPRVARPRRDPQRPLDRHAGRRQRRRGRRDDGVRGPRQHDAGGDRRSDHDPARPEGKGSVPRVLDDVRRVRHPHAVGRGRDRVHVVAGGGAAPVERAPDPVCGPGRRLPRLGRRPRDHERTSPRTRPSTRRRSTTSTGGTPESPARS